MDPDANRFCVIESTDMVVAGGYAGRLPPSLRGP
ncbi:hypothetical protein ABIB27_003702 [Arthrobacter sp. UYEF21]